MDKKLLTSVFVAIFLASCDGLPDVVTAADKPNVIIFGDDADKDTIPRKNRIFNRVINALSNQLNEQGIDVFDETAITLDKGFVQGRTRRTDAEIIDISRLVTRPPIDVAVIFQIYASAKQLSYITKIKTRISGRLLAVKTGQKLGNFEVNSPREWTAPKNCPRECILEVVGDKARILANDLGAVLTEKLVHMMDGTETSPGSGGVPTAFNLVFDGFSSKDSVDIEEYLVAFSGYKNHRPTYSSSRRQEIYYESSIKSARLNRNLIKMLAHLDLRGTVTVSGNTYTIKTVSFRKKRKINRKDW